MTRCFKPSSKTPTWHFSTAPTRLKNYRNTGIWPCRLAVELPHRKEREAWRARPFSPRTRKTRCRSSSDGDGGSCATAQPCRTSGRANRPDDQGFFDRILEGTAGNALGTAETENASDFAARPENLLHYLTCFISPPYPSPAELHYPISTLAAKRSEVRCLNLPERIIETYPLAGLAKEIS